MLFDISNEGWDAINKIGKASACLRGYDSLSSQGIYSRRMRMAKRILEAGDLIEKIPELSTVDRATARMLLLAIIHQFKHFVFRCRNSKLLFLKAEIMKLEMKLKAQLVKKYSRSHETTEEDVDDFLTKSKDHSKKFKMVVTRDGDGSDSSHYKIRSHVAGLHVSDEGLIKNNFPDYEEFLMDEDRDPADISTRDVTVREIRFGKVLSRVKVVHEPKLVIEKA